MPRRARPGPRQQPAPRSERSGCYNDRGQPVKVRRPGLQSRADAKLEQRTRELRSEMRTGLAQASTELHEVRADILKWMFGFWAPTALAVVGTGLGVLNLLLRR